MVFQLTTSELLRVGCTMLEVYWSFFQRAFSPDLSAPLPALCALHPLPLPGTLTSAVVACDCSPSLSLLPLQRMC